MKIDAQPFVFEFDMDHTALVIIDMQRDDGPDETLRPRLFLQVMTPEAPSRIAGYFTR